MTTKSILDAFMTSYGRVDLVHLKGYSKRLGRFEGYALEGSDGDGWHSITDRYTNAADAARAAADLIGTFVAERYGYDADADPDALSVVNQGSRYEIVHARAVVSALLAS